MELNLIYFCGIIVLLSCSFVQADSITITPTYNPKYLVDLNIELIFDSGLKKPIEGTKVTFAFQTNPSNNKVLPENFVILWQLTSPEGTFEFGQTQIINGPFLSTDNLTQFNRILDSPGTWTLKYETFTLDELKEIQSTADPWDPVSTRTKRINVLSFSEAELIKQGRRAPLLVIIATLFGTIIGYLLNYIQDKVKERKNRKESIKSLIHELNTHLKFAKDIFNNSEKYLQNRKVPFKNFVTLNLEKIISGNYFLDSELIDNLFDYYESLMVTNNFLLRMRLPKIPKGIKDMQNIIDNCKAYTKKLPILLKNLQDKKDLSLTTSLKNIVFIGSIMDDHLRNLANMLGLVIGAVGLSLVGFELKSVPIIVSGILAVILFFVLFWLDFLKGWKLKK